MKLYHYTDGNGKDAIVASGFIRMSKADGIKDDAVYGNGVYLTSIPPTASTSRIVGNNWDGMVVPQHKKRQTEWFFEFDTDYDELLYGVESVGDRDIWLLRDRHLAIQGRRPGRRNL